MDDTRLPEEVKALVHRAWLDDWQFFCTEDTIRSKSFDGVFKGLCLPKDVVDKIYYTNAVNRFHIFK